MSEGGYPPLPWRAQWLVFQEDNYILRVLRGGAGDPRFVVNARNCVHYNTCDIKDPTQ